jgi:hypothetical protein
MGRILSKKLVEQPYSAAYDSRCLMHWCPGCEEVHSISVEQRTAGRPVWAFDGNAEAPSFTPSINYVGKCHYFIKAGVIAYCADSVHALAGTSVVLPDFPTDLLYAWGYIDADGVPIDNPQNAAP